MGHAGRRAAASFTALGVALSLATVTACSHTSGTDHAGFSRGGQKIEVAVPGPAGVPHFSALPALRPATVPTGMRVLTQPVHIATKPFTGHGTLSFGYDPGALPRTAQPGRDLSVLAYVPSVSAWLPVGGTVNTAAHTVTVSTTHFSDWALAVTDPQELADEEALDRQLSHTLGGKLGTLITGDQASLDCSPHNLLLAAQMSDDIALPPKLCEEVLSDGSYRLQYVNTTGTPQLIQLPDGFTEHDPSYELDPLLGRLLASGSHSAVVPDGGSLDVRFPGSAVTASTRITGDTDWTVYVVITIREALATALGLKTGNSKMLSKLDDALEKADLYDCASEAPAKLDEAHSAPGKVKALAKLAAKCGKDFAVDDAGKALAALAGVGAEQAESILKRRLDPILDLSDLMDLARGEVAGIPQAMFSAAGMNTRLTIIPVRVMDFAEASALPAPDYGNVSECQAPPTGVPLPAGAPPGIQCLAAVKADLDGNGKPDRLLLWESQAPEDIGGGTGPAPRVGAVAYLDDGTFHLLEEDPASWQLPEELSLEGLHPAQVVSFGDDRRQEVLATTTVGSSTIWNVVLAVGADRRLHTLKAADGTTVALASGGAVAYSSGYGCVDSHGQPLVAEEGATTNRSADGLFAPGYSWTTDYYRLRGLQWTHVAARQGQEPKAQTVKLNVGSDCSNPDPAQRGPEIGTP